MKMLKTNLTEARFLERLETTVCVPYKDYETVLENKTGFVVKRGQNRFCIGQRVKMPRSYGFYAEWLYGTYSVNDHGTVDVQYHFRKPFSYMLPFLVYLAFGVPILIGLLYNGITDGLWQWGGILAVALFAVFGIGGLLMSSQTNRKALQNRLMKICRCKES